MSLEFKYTLHAFNQCREVCEGAEAVALAYYKLLSQKRHSAYDFSNFEEQIWKLSRVASAFSDYNEDDLNKATNRYISILLKGFCKRITLNVPYAPKVSGIVEDRTVFVILKFKSEEDKTAFLLKYS